MQQKFLYLRTVFWFNFKAGGSVGHTAGVVNSLAKKTKLTVFTNDDLAEVNYPLTYFKPRFLKLWPGPLVSWAEMIYSLLVIFKLVVTGQNVFTKSAFAAIYQRYSGCSFAGAFLANRYNIPFILEFNSSDVWKLKHWQQSTNKLKKILRHFYFKWCLIPIVKKIEKYNLRSAKQIVVVSEVLKENLINDGVIAEKILVNPNGVDLEKYSPKISGEAVRKKYGLEDKIVVGFIGSFGQWHGVIEMAKAIVQFFENNSQRRSDTRFLLIGNGVLFQQVKLIIEQSSYQNLVVFTGAITQNQGPQYLAACDIYLSPNIANSDGTKFFGSPTKLFEYMAMGKAIIASRLEQIGEILEHKKTAYLVESGNVEELARAIKIVIEDDSLKNVLGQNALLEVAAKYSWDKHVEKILKVIVN